MNHLDPDPLYVHEDGWVRRKSRVERVLDRWSVNEDEPSLPVMVAAFGVFAGLMVLVIVGAVLVAPLPVPR